MTQLSISRALHLGKLLGVLELQRNYPNTATDYDDNDRQMRAMVISLFHALGLSNHADLNFTSGYLQFIQSDLWGRHGDKTRLALHTGFHVPLICMLDSNDFEKASQLLNEIRDNFEQLGLPAQKYDRLLSDFPRQTHVERISKFEALIDEYFDLETDTSSKIVIERGEITMGNRITIANSTIGLLNTGTIEKVKAITTNLNSLDQNGYSEVAQALHNLSEAVVSSAEVTDEQREELVDQLQELSLQAALPDSQRTSRGVIKALLGGLATGLGAAGSLAEVWSTWGPILVGFFN